MFNITRMLKGFRKHCESMSDEEIAASIAKAEAMTKGFNTRLFKYKYIDEFGNQGQGVIEAHDFSEVADYIKSLTNGAFVPSVEIEPFENL